MNGVSTEPRLNWFNKGGFMSLDNAHSFPSHSYTQRSPDSNVWIIQRIIEAIHENPRVTQEDLLTEVDYKAKYASI
jgi:hypothetical protein